MYVTDAGLEKIERSRLDGSDTVQLVTSDLSVPEGLALDVAAQEMYWVDWGTSQAMKATMQGGNVQALITTGCVRASARASVRVGAVHRTPRVTRVPLWGFSPPPGSCSPKASRWTCGRASGTCTSATGALTPSCARTSTAAGWSPSPPTLATRAGWRWTCPTPTSTGPTLPTTASGDATSTVGSGAEGAPWRCWKPPSNCGLRRCLDAVQPQDQTWQLSYSQGC